MEYSPCRARTTDSHIVSPLSTKQLTTCRSMCFRGAILFNIGALLTILVGLFQGSKAPDDNKISFEIFRQIFLLGWWIVPICGVCSAFIGILYPFIDIVSGKIGYMSSCDFASSLKCIVLFLGLNHLCARFLVEDRILTNVFPLLCVLFWYLFDSSLRGLVVDFSMACLAMLVEYSFLLTQTDYANRFLEQFQSARFWVPFIFFVGSVTTGHIGRQLASYELWRTYNESFSASSSEPSTDCLHNENDFSKRFKDFYSHEHSE